MEISESTVGLDTALTLGLNEEEYEKIVEVLGREPNFVELSIYSVMWSEHCSYKNSINLLKTLPRDGEKLLVGAGEENAGLVDIGEGLACAFKIESHNHPSAIEPYQGAATGVGGIHRDIFTMGARPIAALNSLRFGDINLNQTRHLVKGVVSGIGDYGNCLGVPTVGGEVYFNNCYNQNILVNAMSVGTVKVGETVSAIADGPGNPVFIVGSSTGKDGIHGATFASADLTEDSAEDLPAVQVGDPFQEKLLLESSLEAIKTGAIVGMQDMGAAGICCSSSEMSAKSGTGMRIDLDLVPTRQKNMEAWEMLLSESQERMLIVCKKGMESELQTVFDKWDLECELIGEVTDTGRLQFLEKGIMVVDVPAESLVLGGGAPVYTRETAVPAYFSEIEKYDISDVNEPSDFKKTAWDLMQSPNLLSKRWIYEQYDSMVRTNSMSTNDPSDASLTRLKGTQKALATSVDCNSSYVYADPYIGAMIAVSEAARNVVCSGAEPVAITNCLNFGNPYNPEVYYQFSNAIKGMGEACRKFSTPVTGGNVSFYNQSVFADDTQPSGTRTEPIYPTPTIGMLGLIEDLDDQMTLNFKAEGNVIYVIGENRNDISQSEYLRFIHKVTLSPPPYFDLEEEYKLQNSIKELIKSKLIESAHDISEGGIFTNLLESSITSNLGFRIVTSRNIRKDSFLFGESQSRVIVSVKSENELDFQKYLSENSVMFQRIGEVTDGNLRVDGEDFGQIQEWKEVFQNKLNHILDQ
jgi:phosphoribosylformylglycinamidine synthase